MKSQSCADTQKQQKMPPESAVIGASTIASALGLKGAWMTRAELWRVMTARKANPPIDRMAWGQDHEYRGVHVVEVEQGILYAETGKAQRSHFLDAEGYVLRATPDGLYRHCNGDRAGLEVKSPERLHDEVRPQIICQVQFQAFVCDLADITVIEWTFQGYRAWHVEPSAVYVNWAMPMVDEFMAFFRDDLEPPRLKKAPEPPGVEVTKLFEELKENCPF